MVVELFIFILKIKINLSSQLRNECKNLGWNNNFLSNNFIHISFTATDRAGEKIIIDSDYVKKNLDELVKDTDLSKSIL